MDDGNRLTVYELVERVIPCIIAKHYSENYIQGFRSTFRNLLAYCNKNEKKYFTAELAQQFMLDCYGVQPGTVERRCSRVHRAMDLLSDYQHFNAVMLRRRLNREFPAGLQEGAVNYLQKLSLHGRRENTLRSHRNTAVGSFFPQITPHCLRHSKAMHLVEAGKNLIYIRDFLGHESIETTQVYAKANPEARRKALETMDTRMNTPAMPDWNDDPDLKAFLKTL